MTGTTQDSLLFVNVFWGVLQPLFFAGMSVLALVTEPPVALLSVPMTLLSCFISPLWFSADEDGVVVHSVFVPKGVRIAKEALSVKRHRRYLVLRSARRSALVPGFVVGGACPGDLMQELAELGLADRRM